MATYTYLPSSGGAMRPLTMNMERVRYDVGVNAVNGFQVERYDVLDRNGRDLAVVAIRGTTRVHSVYDFPTD